MSFGPFATYVPPGVYSRTLTEANVASLIAGLRIPFIIGVGQEELEQDDLEMVRGSSSTLDEQIVNEDITLRWIVDNTNPSNPVLGVNDGSRVTFQVRNFPLVDGQGFGRVTNDTRSVTVTVNGSPVAVGSVLGSLGEVTLQVPPQPTDTVRVTYYFHRGDTAFTDNVSAQVSAVAPSITTPGFELFVIVAGVNDTLKVTPNNGSEQTVTFVPGSSTALSLKTQIDAAAISGLATSVFADNEGLNHLTLTAVSSVSIGTGTANGILGLSAGQTASGNTQFRVFQRPIVDGTSGGITTTDTSKVVVKVNNTQVIPTAVDGTNGIVTLALAPPPGSTVTINYWANTWQDTFDYLPNTLVTNVIRCGISSGRSDYIQNQDFVVVNPSQDVSIVHWGTSYSVSSTLNTPGAEPFDSSQIVPTLVDDKLYLVECDAFVDTTVIPAAVSNTVFVLPEVPTTGNGRDSVLGQSLYSSVANNRQDLITNRPDLVVARVGRNLEDALGRPAATVLSVDGPNRKITLKNALPPDWTVFATFYYNRITDDTYIVTNKVPGPLGVGQYEVFSSLFNKNLYQIRFGSKNGTLTQTVQWPRGVEQIPDAMHVGGTPVSETVTVTFGQSAARNAVYTNLGAQPYSFYTGASDTWRTLVNGATVPTVLGTATRAYLVSREVPLTAGSITIPVGGADLNLTIDGVAITVPFIAGAITPANIAVAVNAAIDALAPFSTSAANDLFTVIPGSGATSTFFVIRGYSVPAALPGGFDHQSNVTINQGTAETLLGFTTFQAASGTTGAINKPATLIGSVPGTFNITAGLNDTLKMRINGVDFQVTLPNGAAVATSAIVTAVNLVISSQGTASVGTLGNLNKLRITSVNNSPQSAILIQDGTSNSILGFTESEFASQTLVDVQEVVDSLMDTTGFAVSSWGTPTVPGPYAAPVPLATGCVAYPDVINNQTYLTIASLTTGAVTSSVGFVSGSQSAFNTTSGTGIVPGTSGDNGESATNNFVVTSSLDPIGHSAGSYGTGFPGQTYTDARTGLRFSILPSTTTYATSGTFTLVISQTFQVNPGIPYYYIPGLETIVTNTVNVGVNDTANVQTFNPSGLEPKNGDYYYISYRYMKQDFSTRIFTTFKTIEANYGKLNAENRVVLGAYLAILNGAVLVGITQVLKVPNTNQAAASSFITAIQGLATPLPGNVKPDVIVPLSTDTAVYSALTQHCEVMSNIRNQSERMGMIGFASGTSPTTAQTIAKGLFSSRIVAFYPDSSVVTFTDELGNTFESLVDGTFYAAAMAGAVCSPAVDVATPYTHRQLQGFTRIPRIMDPVEANQTAVAGITILEDLQPIIRVRQGLTTNMTSVLTRLPTVTQIADYVSISSRSVLDAFVGTKFLASRTNEVEVSMTSLFKQLIQQEIVAAFTGISATVDASDPTTLNAEAYYQPIFPLLYLVLTFNLRARI